MFSKTEATDLNEKLANISDKNQSATKQNNKNIQHKSSDNLFFLNII